MSHCASSPELTLPRTSFDDWRKVKISKAHVADIVGVDAPGPEYLTTEKSMSTLGTKTTKVGTSLRPDLALSLGVDPHGSPGPLAYNPPGPFEVRIRSMTNNGAKGTGFGTAPRFQDPSALGRPDIGPGQYTPKGEAISKST